MIISGKVVVSDVKEKDKGYMCFFTYMGGKFTNFIFKDAVEEPPVKGQAFDVEFSTEHTRVPNGKYFDDAFKIDRVLKMERVKTGGRKALESAA